MPYWRASAAARVAYLPDRTGKPARLGRMAVAPRLLYAKRPLRRPVGVDPTLPRALYDPTQPRVPAGSPNGGEWTKGDLSTAPAPWPTTPPPPPVPISLPTPDRGALASVGQVHHMRVRSPHEMDLAFYNAMQFSKRIGEPMTPLSEDIAEGVQMGLSDLQRETPWLYEQLTQRVTLLAGDYTPTVAKMTTTRDPWGGVTITINSDPAAQADMTRVDASEATHSVPQAITAEARPSTPAKTRVLLAKTALVHEGAHVLDYFTDEDGVGVSRRLITLLKQERETGTLGQMGAVAKLMRSVSEYANTGGPQEAVAEIFTAALYKRPLPPFLQPFAADLLAYAKTGVWPRG